MRPPTATAPPAPAPADPPKPPATTAPPAQATPQTAPEAQEAAREAREPPGGEDRAAPEAPGGEDRAAPDPGERATRPAEDTGEGGGEGEPRPPDAGDAEDRAAAPDVLEEPPAPSADPDPDVDADPKGRAGPGPDDRATQPAEDRGEGEPRPSVAGDAEGRAAPGPGERATQPAEDTSEGGGEGEPRPPDAGDAEDRAAAPATDPIQLRLDIALPDPGPDPDPAPTPPAAPPGANLGRAVSQLQLGLPFLGSSIPPPGAGRVGETFLGHLRIERALKARIGPRVVLRLSAQRGRVLSFYRRRGVCYVTAHLSFQDAPRAVLESLAAYVSDRGYGPHQAELLDRFLAERRRALGSCDAPAICAPQGQAHDLGELFERLNATYFGDTVRARVTWAGRAPGRRLPQLGAYRAADGLIRIHPALDQASVPEPALAFVLFCEMLKARPRARGGRAAAQLLAEQRSFKGYAEAQRWLRDHRAQLLGA